MAQQDLEAALRRQSDFAGRQSYIGYDRDFNVVQSAYPPESQRSPIVDPKDESVIQGILGVQDPMQQQAEQAFAEGIEKQKELELVRIGGGLVGLPISAALAGADLVSLPILIAQGAITAEEGEIASNILKQFESMPSAYVGAQLKDAVAGMGYSQETVDAFGEGYLAGELLAVTSSALPGLKLAAKGATKLKEGVTNYVAGAEARVAERGTTLMSGVDPQAALDEVITGFSRAREVKLPTDDAPGIIVFHGSGSDFDRFELSKIGTGEGNQAFGRGLYFTDLEDIAKFYRDAMGAGKEVTYKGRKLKDVDSETMSVEEHLAVMVGQQDTKEAMRILADREMTTARKNLAAVEQAISDFEMNPEAYPLKIFGMSVDMEKALEVKQFNQSRIDAATEVEKNIDSISAKPAGKVYQAKLKVDPKKLLDYDKPIAAQNSFVRGKIKELVQEINLDDAVNLGFDPFEMGEEAALQAARESMLDSEVLTFLNTWRDIRGVEGAAEELLDKYGIKGIKYKAMQGAGARNVPETGAQNYVIFDDQLIEIMKKYGIVGPVAVSSVVASQDDQNQGEAQ